VILVRPAVEADLPAMSGVLTASIRDLCGADHHDNPEIVARWTANKTIEGVRAMLANPNSRMFVAEREGEVAAVGSILGDDEIGLNYVHPAHRFRGVSKALLEAMESELRSRGVAEARLVSTTTARRFYLGAGWRDAGPAEDHAGLICYPMRKRLLQAS
jgi:GNAT superfamily N-acetyltransferase